MKLKMCPPRDARSSTKTVSATSCYLYLIDIWPVFIVPSVNPLRGAIYLFIHLCLFITCFPAICSTILLFTEKALSL
jgi:hypothetical protein